MLNIFQNEIEHRSIWYEKRLAPGCRSDVPETSTSFLLPVYGAYSGTGQYSLTSLGHSLYRPHTIQLGNPNSHIFSNPVLQCINPGPRRWWVEHHQASAEALKTQVRSSAHQVAMIRRSLSVTHYFQITVSVIKAALKYQYRTKITLLNQNRNALFPLQFKQHAIQTPFIRHASL